MIFLGAHNFVSCIVLLYYIMRGEDVYIYIFIVISSLHLNLHNKVLSALAGYWCESLSEKIFKNRLMVLSSYGAACSMHAKTDSRRARAS
jgi:hypothetical protein